MKVLLLLPLLACAVPQYTTKHGIDVYCEDLNRCLPKEEVEIISDVFFATALFGSYARAQVEEEGLSIDVRPYNYACPDTVSATGMCAGTYYSKDRLLVVAYRECSAETALTHELAHYTQDKALGMSDLYHPAT